MVTKELGLKTGILDRQPPASGPGVWTPEDVEAWIRIYETNGSSDTRANDILCMMNEFRHFCEQYVKEVSRLSKSQISRQSPQWLANAMDNVLFSYWEPIRLAAQQYQVAHWTAQQIRYRDLFVEGYERLELLQNEPASRPNFKMDLRIILYFEQTGKAKRYPFGNTYLIGIPLLDAYAGDWNAIPHELGHHVFWNAKFSDKDNTPVPAQGKNFLSKEVAKALEGVEESPAREHLRRILDNWTEEIFADVFGTGIVQQGFVEAAWDRVVRKVAPNKKRDLFLSDWVHPMPYALPYIRTFAAKTSTSDQEFIDRWTKLYGDMWYRKLVLQENNEVAIPLKTLCSVLKSYVENIMGRLETLQIDKIKRASSPMHQFNYLIEQIDGGKEAKKKLRLLLNPLILERNESWTCSCGRKNNGDDRRCPGCRQLRNALSILPLWLYRGR